MRNSNKNTIYVEDNNTNIYAKFQLHPPYNLICAFVVRICHKTNFRMTWPINEALRFTPVYFKLLYLSVSFDLQVLYWHLYVRLLYGLWNQDIHVPSEQPSMSNRKDICLCHSFGRILIHLAVTCLINMFVTGVSLLVLPSKTCNNGNGLCISMSIK